MGHKGPYLQALLNTKPANFFHQQKDSVLPCLDVLLHLLYLQGREILQANTGCQIMTKDVSLYHLTVLTHSARVLSARNRCSFHCPCKV